MKATIFEATYFATQQITATFDIVWALDAGLWNFRKMAAHLYEEYPDISDPEAIATLVKGLYIHGLNPKRIAMKLTWEYEEHYIAQILLTYAFAIFDSWVNSFVDAVILNKSNTRRDDIKKDLKQGKFDTLDAALAQEPASIIAGFFYISAVKQDAYIDKLRLVYKYFKSCRNCCAHGDGKFSKKAEENYNAIKVFTKDDCGVKEMPKIVETKEGQPLQLILRGVVGFFDILIRIIKHYDTISADKYAIEAELIRRWKTIPSVTLSVDVHKRNRSIRNYFKSINMFPPYAEKTNDIFNFLVTNGMIK